MSCGGDICALDAAVTDMCANYVNAPMCCGFKDHLMFMPEAREIVCVRRHRDGCPVTRIETFWLRLRVEAVESQP